MYHQTHLTKSGGRKTRHLPPIVESERVSFASAFSPVPASICRLISSRASRAIGLTCFLMIAAQFTGISADAPELPGAHELAPLNVEGRPYGEELVGPYNQPRWSARGRFSADTDVYVLPPYSFYVDLDYHGTFPRRGFSDHLFIQEFEIGLPYRLQLAYELYQEVQNGHSQVPFMLIEGRYALANWGKIPLNPTLLAEYSFGTGKQYPVQPGSNKESEAGDDQQDTSDTGDQVRRETKKNVPNAYELRLLLGQEIAKCVQFATNIFFDQDLSGDREREVGFSTAASYAIRAEALKIGLETSYRNVSQPGNRRNAKNIFEIGPSFTVKPSPHTRIDIAPLIGTTYDSPHLELFAIFSIDFGTGAEREAEGPTGGGGRFQ
jgi:hypothetical protein